MLPKMLPNSQKKKKPQGGASLTYSFYLPLITSLTLVRNRRLSQKSILVKLSELDFIEGISGVSGIVGYGIDAESKGECFHLAFIL